MVKHTHRLISKLNYASSFINELVYVDLNLINIPGSKSEPAELIGEEEEEEAAW